MRPASSFSLRAFLLLAGLALAGCRGGDEPDAYGNFEATEVIVSAETSGQLLWFTPDNGQRIDSGSMVGLIDTTQLALERNQVISERGAGTSRASEVSNQLNVLEAEREIAQRGYERTQRLHSGQAATAQQLDQAEREYRVLGAQIEVTRAQRRTAEHDIASTGARLAQIEDRLQKSRIVNPRVGTVLTSYAEPGEFVQQGQPLYKIANLDSMELRAYVTEPQLSLVRIGQTAQVTIDVGGEDRRTLTGIVTWVSSEAEFTPTPVQTREERADLVYALKIRVPNQDGSVKIGMPADVRFTSAADSAR
jgi:HlyD family secretion protein